MHAITSCIAAANPSPTDFPFHLYTPPAESPFRKASRKLSKASRKMRAVHRSTLKKVTELANSANPTVRKSRAAAAQRLAELTSAHEAACLIAFKEESEKNRLVLKESMMRHWSPAHFDRVFPPGTLKYVNDAWAKEASDRIWNELVSASETE